MIICFSFEDIYNSEYVVEESFICEIIIEKLCYYFVLNPLFFELEKSDHLLDIGYNIKHTFPSMYKKYFDFWDFIHFLNKFLNTIRSIKLKERLKLLFFNNFLLKYIQERLCSCNLRIVRSSLQYIILLVNIINDQDIINLIFNFIFGFNDSKTNYVFTYNTEEQTSFLAETLSHNGNSNNSNQNTNENYDSINESNNSINDSGRKKKNSINHYRTNSFNSYKKSSNINDNLNINLNNNEAFLSLNSISNINYLYKENNMNSNVGLDTNKKIINNKKSNESNIYVVNYLFDNNNTNISTKQSEEKFNNNKFEKDEPIENFFNFKEDYNFKFHNNIRIGLKIFNNMNNENEKINLVISLLFEKFFEKCPFLMFNRLVFPFADFCLRQIEDPNKFLKVKKTIPDIDVLYNLVKLYDSYKNLGIYFEENIKLISFNTLNYYIKNDIDFYYYYLSQRQDDENFDYYNENEINQKDIHDYDILKKDQEQEYFLNKKEYEPFKNKKEINYDKVQESNLNNDLKYEKIENLVYNNDLIENLKNDNSIKYMNTPKNLTTRDILFSENDGLFSDHKSN